MESTFTFSHRTLDWDKGEMTFSYLLETQDASYPFTETITFPPEGIHKVSEDLLKTLLQQIHLALGSSYWKTTCAKHIILDGFSLTKEQAGFWNTLYTKGLGEFYYKNQIDFRDLVHFPYVMANGNETSLREISQQVGNDKKDNNTSLVFFGGGKDSIVTTELLKKGDMPLRLFMVNEAPIQEETARLTGQQTLVFQRHIDPHLLELNTKEGFYNGHVPVLAMWSFISLFAAKAYGYSQIITSNEQSSNFGNTSYLGEEINHQWDKSFEFENLFRDYITTYVTQETEYFSLLRPLHEIAIVKEFTHYPQYFSSFSSCNTNFKIGNLKLEIGNSSPWCGKCPKCLFVFILLSAFVDKPTLLSIFQKNLFENVSLLPLLKQLLGEEGTKPFECVGTPEETMLALSLAHAKKDYDKTPLMQHFLEGLIPTDEEVSHLSKKLLRLSQEHHIPEMFFKLLPLL